MLNDFIVGACLVSNDKTPHQDTTDRAREISENPLPKGSVPIESHAHVKKFWSKATPVVCVCVCVCVCVLAKYLE